MMGSGILRFWNLTHPIQLAVTLALFANQTPVLARVPKPLDCSGVERYPFSVAITTLQNHNQLNVSDVDLVHSKSKTIATKMIRSNLQRQVLLLEIHTNHKGVIQAIVVNYASKDECSMGGTKIYIVSELH